MMIQNRVPELVAEKFGGRDKINIAEIERDSGIAYATVARWVKNRVDRADFPILEAWCKYLNCNVGDLLDFVPDKE